MYPVTNPDPTVRARKTLFVDAEDVTGDGLRIVFGAPKREQDPGEDSTNRLSVLDMQVVGNTLSIRQDGVLLTLGNSAPATAPFNIAFVPGGSQLIQYATFNSWVTHNLTAISSFLTSPPSYGLFFLRHDSTGTAQHLGRWRVSSGTPAEYECFSHRSGDSSATSNGNFFIARLTASRTFDLFVTSGSQIYLNVLGFIP
jgi:hypothetical protein